jgi:hypothetical protein
MAAERQAEEREVLLALLGLLEGVGSANDAEDHGYQDEAERIRSEHVEAIRALSAEHAFVRELLPGLAEELDSGHVFGFGWADLRSAIGARLLALCEVCSELADEEYALQKYGWPEGSSELPGAAVRLELVRDLKEEGGSRLLQLKRCPLCGTPYLYRTDYEYLTNGTEDEEFLTRLTEVQAEEYLRESSGATEE